MASGVATPKVGEPFGSNDYEATHCLVLDRNEHTVWVVRLEEAMPSLMEQHLPLDDEPAIGYELCRQRQEIEEAATIHNSLPCHCDRGWNNQGVGMCPARTVYGRAELRQLQTRPRFSSKNTQRSTPALLA